MTARRATGPADLRDQRWLDERIADIDNGMEAVIDIARNWTDGRNLARLHPGVSAQDYILARVQPLGRGVVVPLLQESNWSNRQIAAVAGVDEATVRRASTAANAAVERPDKTLGADGKLRAKPVKGEVIEPSEMDLDAGPDEPARDAAYVEALRQYIAGITRVQPPALGDPPRLYRRRHQLERHLQKVLAEVMS